LVSLALWAALLALPSTAWAQPGAIGRQEQRQISLRIGEQRSISAHGIRNYSVGVDGIADIRVTTDGSRFVVVGRSPGETTLLLIPDEGPHISHEIVVVGLDDPSSGIHERETIRLDFYFVQFDDNYARQTGIGWPDSVGTGGVFNFGFDFQAAMQNGLRGGLSQAAMVFSDQPLPRLDLMESTGWARILRQVSMVTANGNEATFTSGGEFNVVVTSAMAAEVRSIDFGSTVNVIPRYDRESGRMELQINAEVVDLNDDLGVGVPGVTNSTVDTQVNLEMGQAVALGGLISHSEMNSTRGLPGVGRIPVLGMLFASHQRRRLARQVVLFIVPSVVDIVDQDAETRIGDAVELYWNYRGRLDQQTLVPPSPSSPSLTRPGRNSGTSRRSR
jgi:pilus assembly protein CpaC